MPLGVLVFTSNVDGQFQKAGFAPDGIVECHGSIHHLQCAKPCGQEIWSASDLELDVDEATIRTKSVLPECPRCGGIARPNILMFGDRHWIEDRSAQQRQAGRTWLRRATSNRLVTIELGAGLAVPSVRIECESQDGILIRVNPREADVPKGGISLPVGALEALRGMDTAMNRDT